MSVVTSIPQFEIGNDCQLSHNFCGRNQLRGAILGSDWLSQNLCSRYLVRTGSGVLWSMLTLDCTTEIDTPDI